MPSDQGAGRLRDGQISRWAAQLLSIWLGVLLPIATLVQLTYLGDYLARLPQTVLAALTFLMVAMVTLSLWAAIGVWQQQRDARQRVDRALLASIAVNMLGCAPLSILMSAPPYFLPVIVATLICFALLDAWYEPDTA